MLGQSQTVVSKKGDFDVALVRSSPGVYTPTLLSILSILFVICSFLFNVKSSISVGRDLTSSMFFTPVLFLSSAPKPCKFCISMDSSSTLRVDEITLGSNVVDSVLNSWSAVVVEYDCAEGIALYKANFGTVFVVARNALVTEAILFVVVAGSVFRVSDGIKGGGVISVYGDPKGKYPCNVDRGVCCVVYVS